MRKLLPLGALVMLAAQGHELTTVDTVFFRADMLVQNEVPAVTAFAGARAILAAHLRRDDHGAILAAAIDFDIDYSFEGDGSFSGLHIHEGAAGTNGPVVVDSGLATADAIPARGVGNLFRSTFLSSPAELASLRALLSNPSRFYVNLHTTQHPGGVLRAQLSRAEMRVIRADLTAAGGTARGTGNLIFLTTRDARGSINASTISFETSFAFGSPVTLSEWHIQRGDGTAVIHTPLSSGSPDAQNATSGTIRRRIDVVSGDGLAAVQGIWANPANYALRLVSNTATLRGPLESTVRNSYDVLLETDQAIPFVTNLVADATAKISVFSTRSTNGEIGSATVIFDLFHEFPGNTTFTGLTVHPGVPGAVGPAAVDSGISGSAVVSDADGQGSFYRVVDVSALSPTALTAIRGMATNPSAYYVNLLTITHPSGAVRGMLSTFSPGRPIINRGGVMNGAGYAKAGVAPGSIVAVFGTNLTNGSVCLASEGCMPRFSAGVMERAMGGTTVTVNGMQAPIFFTTPSQLAVQIPVEVNGSTAAIVVTADGQTSVPETISLDPAAPGLFSVAGDGDGAGAITHADGSLVTAANPAARNETLVLYATGFGATASPVPTGTVTVGPIPTLAQPRITVGGVPAVVTYSGQSPCCVGLNQLNFIVPTGAQSGDVPVAVTIANKISNPVTLTVR